MLQKVEFEYDLPEHGDMDLELGDTLNALEQEEQAKLIILNMFPDIENLKIISIKAAK